MKCEFATGLNPERAVAASKDQTSQTRNEIMNRYQPSTFRPAFGIAAAAMSAVTLAVLVVLPVSFAACPGDGTIANAPAAVEVAIVPAHIDVVAPSVRVVKLDPVSVVAWRNSQAS